MARSEPDLTHLEVSPAGQGTWEHPGGKGQPCMYLLHCPQRLAPCRAQRSLDTSCAGWRITDLRVSTLSTRLRGSVFADSWKRCVGNRGGEGRRERVCRVQACQRDRL